MANRFFTPRAQFLDDDGDAYAGGKLYFYLTGTNTLANTYSDYLLTTANSNPMTLDSAGRLGDCFLDNIAYKVRLFSVDAVTGTETEVWTEDPVWSSDYSTYASLRAYNGNPNGNVAGTAATVGTLPGTSMVWDYVNELLYVCTTTGTAVTAVWEAINNPTTATFVPVPTGYLTPTSGTPIITSDVTANTSLVYTPYKGNSVPIYNGTTFTTQNFTELTLSLVSAHAADTIYDVFIFNNSGVLTLVTGPAWSTSTAGSGARGSGAGTTELQRLSGLWVNAVQITGRNGSTTYTIAANLATYLGSILIDGSAGQITLHRSWGQNRRWAIWNAYNRVPIYLKGGDSTATWNYATATWRASNGTANNSVNTLCGLAEEYINYVFRQNVYQSAPFSTVSGTVFGAIGIGVNSTTAPTEKVGILGSEITGTPNLQWVLEATYFQPPALGRQTITALEFGIVTNTPFNPRGGSDDMYLSAQWMG